MNLKFAWASLDDVAEPQETYFPHQSRDTSWILARELRADQLFIDSREHLEDLGFKVLEEVGELFYSVLAPPGWHKETQERWTIIKDEHGNERMRQFYKAAFYDQRAVLVPK